MRIKVETNEKTATPEAAMPSSALSTGPEQAEEDDGDEGGDSDTVHSRATTGASTAPADAASTATLATAAASGTQTKGTESQKGDAKDSPKAAAAPVGSDLTGKINNLVTSDLANVTAGRNFLYIALEAPLQFTLGMVFLYSVLGWSAFVGLAVMVALMPVPAWVTTRLQGVQIDRMKAVGARPPFYLVLNHLCRHFLRRATRECRA